jgi:predicted nucleotidyltransferase
MELIRPIVRVGNSAGVILPKEWLNGKAKVELIAKPLDIKKDVFDILEKYFQEIEGIYLVGSYSRNEETEKSDVDVLVITNKTNMNIIRGKYNLILITGENIKKTLKNNIFPLLPMIKEAKPYLNGNLLDEYKKTKLTYNNLKWHIETTKTILNVNKEQINIDGGSGKISDSVSYSLILRLRQEYILDCLINNKLWSNKEFLNLIKDISGSLSAYEGYLRIKNNLSSKKELPAEEALKLHDYVNSKIMKQEKWLQKRK